MREGPPGRAAVPRRGILRALALAPAALAGCAAGLAERAPPDGGGGSDPAAASGGAAALPPPADPALAAVRGFRLAPDAEPAFVFRAATSRPGEGA